MQKVYDLLMAERKHNTLVANEISKSGLLEIDETLIFSRRKNGKPRYRISKTNTKTMERDFVDISSTKVNEIKELATKNYFNDLYDTITKENKAIDKFIKAYNATSKEEIWEKLPIELQSIIKPIFIPISKRIEDWKNKNTYSYDAYESNKLLKTLNGEFVRSKSEMIIADELYRHKDDLLYKYETEFDLADGGPLIHPDFEIINLKTGKVFYWEHIGLIDDPMYSSNFIKKYNRYVNAKIYPGEKLILSFESTSVPLSAISIKPLIAQIINSK